MGNAAPQTLRHARDLLEFCFEQENADALPTILVKHLPDILETDVAGYYLFDPKLKMRRRELSDGFYEHFQRTEQFLAHRFHEHPLCKHLARHYAGGWVQRVSDVTELRAFMKTSYFREYQEVSGTTKPPFEMSYCGQFHKEHRFALSFARLDRNFDDKERQIVQVLSEPLDALHRQHSTCSQIVRSLQLQLRGEARFASLTPREREILVLLALGLDHGEVADYLRLRTRTISKLLENAFGKLGIDHHFSATAEVTRLIHQTAAPVE